MPFDTGFTGSFSSSFLGNMKSSFASDEISASSQLKASMDRKRKYFEDENQDISSFLTPNSSLHCVYLDMGPDDNLDFLPMPAGKKSLTSQDIPDKTGDPQNSSLHDCYDFASVNDRQNVSSSGKQDTHLLDESSVVPNEISARAVPNEISTRAVPNEISARVVPNEISARAVPNEVSARAVPSEISTRAVPNEISARAVPSEISTRAVPNEISLRVVPSEISARAVPSEKRDREELSNILKNLPSRGSVDEHGLGAAVADLDCTMDDGSFVLLPMEHFMDKMAQKIKDRIVMDWTDAFSQMESFETTKLEQLDQILRGALDYEAKLKNEKAQLRNFLIKLSYVLNQD